MGIGWKEIQLEDGDIQIDVDHIFLSCFGFLFLWKLLQISEMCLCHLPLLKPFISFFLCWLAVAEPAWFEAHGPPNPSYKTREGVELQFHSLLWINLCCLPRTLRCKCGIWIIWLNWYTRTCWWGLKPDETFLVTWAYCFLGSWVKRKLGAHETKEDPFQYSSYNDQKVFPWILALFSQAEDLRKLEN